MAVFDNIEDAREYFKGEKFATGAGMQIDEMTDDYGQNFEHKAVKKRFDDGVLNSIINTDRIKYSQNIPCLSKPLFCRFLKERSTAICHTKSSFNPA